MLHHERLRAQAWLRAAESMYVPYGEKLKIAPQDDNSGQESPGTSETRRPTTIRSCSFTIRYHPLNIYR
jgi:hypothetical protein